MGDLSRRDQIRDFAARLTSPGLVLRNFNGGTITRKPINRFPLIIHDVPTPPPVVMNNPGDQKLFIIRGGIFIERI